MDVRIAVVAWCDKQCGPDAGVVAVRLGWSCRLGLQQGKLFVHGFVGLGRVSEASGKGRWWILILFILIVNLGDTLPHVSAACQCRTRCWTPTC
jgi:hypothetical protein